jgi:hypothetical protein
VHGAAGELDALGELGVVAADDVEGVFVGTEHNCVGAVFPSALDGLEVLGVFELVIAIEVAEAPEALAFALFIDHDVEAIEGIEEAVGAADGAFEAFDFAGFG